MSFVHRPPGILDIYIYIYIFFTSKVSKMNQNDFVQTATYLRWAFKYFINEKIYLSRMSRLKDSMCSRQLRQNSTLWDKIQQYCEVSLKLFLIFPILQRGKMLESKCTKSYFFAQWKLDLITITKSLNQRFSQRRSEGSLSCFEKKPWLRLVTWLPKSGGQK